MNQNSGETADLDMMREIEDRVKSRLLALERETERLRIRSRILIIGLLVSLGLVTIVAVNPDLLAVTGIHAGSEALSIRHLVLLDDRGLPRGEWTVDEEGSGSFRGARRSHFRPCLSVRRRCQCLMAFSKSVNVSPVSRMWLLNKARGFLLIWSSC